MMIGALLLCAGAIGPARSAGPVRAPDVFSVRLEGFAFESTQQTTSTQLAPRTGYSFAKVNSTPSLDGGRSLDLEARGATNQDNGFGGVVVFTANNGSAVPGYSAAFFPVFEGFSTVSEKCAANQTEYKETPECRSQPGPYSLAQVVPDEVAPRAIGLARNSGEGDAGDTVSRAEVTPQADGTVLGRQQNRGRNQGVPGTPIIVEAYVAEIHIEATPAGVAAEGACTGTVSVGGQRVDDDEGLQAALASVPTNPGLTVRYEPPSAVQIDPKPGGGLEVRCRGPRFQVSNTLQGGTSVTYTYGSAFGAAGRPENRTSPSESTPAGPPGGAAPPAQIGTVTARPPASAGAVAPAAVRPAPSAGTEATPAPAATDSSYAAPPASPTDPAVEPVSSSGLIERRIDTLPVGVWTGLAGVALPLGVWLLLGVTGSLARGATTLRLPPFRD